MPRSLRRFAQALSITLLASASISASRAGELDLSALSALSPDTEQSPIPRGLVLGGVAIGANARYEQQDATKLLIPGFVYFGKSFMFLGDRARYYFYTNQASGIAAFAYGRARFGNLDPDEEGAYFAGMHRRKSQLEAGVGANMATRFALLTARVSSDVTGVSKGQEMLVWADFPMVLDRFLLMPGMGAVWRSSKLANYYFGGVGADEAAPGRPAYDTGAAFSPMFSLVTTYRFNKQWIGTASGGLEFFDSDIANSPTINHKRELTGILGVGYIW